MEAAMGGSMKLVRARAGLSAVTCGTEVGVEVE